MGLKQKKKKIESCFCTCMYCMYAYMYLPLLFSLFALPYTHVYRKMKDAAVLKKIASNVVVHDFRSSTYRPSGTLVRFRDDTHWCMGL